MKGAIEDYIVKWEPYTKAEKLCVRFSLEQWKQIAGDIQSDIEWADFIGSYSNSVKCWVLKNKRTNSSIAFVYIFNEDGKWNTISIHGGGWKNSIMHYRGWMVILKHLLELGLKVRTACQKNNTTAYRFIKSAGFVNYSSSDTYDYFWINKQRLTSSKIYKRFYQFDKK